MVQRYTALSHNLQDYLREQIGVPEKNLTHICNGVDTEKFKPADTGSRDILPAGFADPGTLVFGTVGRMEAVKIQITLAEGISNTILEAMASGLPVVATDVGGNSELVDPEITGFLVKRGDPAALAKAMR